MPAFFSFERSFLPSAAYILTQINFEVVCERCLSEDLNVSQMKMKLKEVIYIQLAKRMKYVDLNNMIVRVR